MLKRTIPNLLIIFGILVIITGLVKIMNIPTGPDISPSDRDGILMFLTGTTLAFTGFFIAAYEDRTQSGKDRSRRISASLTGFFFSVIVLFLILGTTSCTTQGYGCKGNSKNMLRVPRYY